jgi:hypothetical protein
MAAMIKLCAEMRKAFQAELEELLTQVAEEFKLDPDAVFAFVNDRRQESAEAVKEVVEKSKTPKAKRTRTKKEESESEGEAQTAERGKCEAKTAKGLPCKNNALADCKFCRVHNKGPLSSAKLAKEPDSEPEPEPTKPKKTRARKSKQTEPKPEHNHPVEEESEEPCERCETEYKVDDDLERQLAEFKAQLESDPDYVPDAASVADDD